MKVFTTIQIRQIDQLTIASEPIASIDLMERAADAILRWFLVNVSATKRVIIFVGMGNNGGDGLALARMLVEAGYNIEVYILDSPNLSPDCKLNLDRLNAQGIVSPFIIKESNNLPVIDKDSIVVDALFGSGLARPLSGIGALVVEHINRSEVNVISIDIPSGLFGEANPFPNTNLAVHASITLTLQFPKLSFFFPENNKFVGNWEVLPIGLSKTAISTTETPFYYTDHAIIKSIIRRRNRFSHKGEFGHCLLVVGSKGMMGAAVLSSSSCIKSGAGLVTAHVPKVGYEIMQQSVPEVIIDIDADENNFSSVELFSKYSAIGVGSGIGRSKSSVSGLTDLLKNVKVPLLIDADGLNIISDNPDLFGLVPSMTVITPHPGEFDRLFGKCESGYQRLQAAINEASQRNIVIVLKGAFTQVVCPSGQVYFNSTGNAGMATAGSGDVLTGIITSLLGQGYDPISATVLGVYIHGLAGDFVSDKKEKEALTASDIVFNIGNAFKLISRHEDE